MGAYAELDVSVFEASSDTATMAEAQALVAEAHRQRKFTDTAKFTLRCLVWPAARQTLYPSLRCLSDIAFDSRTDRCVSRGSLANRAPRSMPARPVTSILPNTVERDQYRKGGLLQVGVRFAASELSDNRQSLSSA